MTSHHCGHTVSDFQMSGLAADTSNDTRAFATHYSLLKLAHGDYIITEIQAECFRRNFYKVV
jgi:hypothetical protein